jgi:hypothetical protein
MRIVSQALGQYASPALRDSFLVALEDGDASHSSTLHGLARSLLGCTNPLPTAICLSLGLPPGSTYAQGARVIVTAQESTGAAA